MISDFHLAISAIYRQKDQTIEKRSVALNYAQKLDIRSRMKRRAYMKKRKFEKNVLETKLTTFEKDV